MSEQNPNPASAAPFVVPGQVRVGHVHLKVADLERAIGFYHGVLGFEVMQRLGDGAAFLSAGGYHHHIGLNTWESLGGEPPPPGTTGLYHTAINYPTRAALAEGLRRVLAAGIPLEGAADHGVSESIYLRDPTATAWSCIAMEAEKSAALDAAGRLTMYTRPLDLTALLGEALAWRALVNRSAGLAPAPTSRSAAGLVPGADLSQVNRGISTHTH
jgi:catechol 2,3-dioxygenase